MLYKGHLTISENTFGDHSWVREKVILASNGWKVELPLSPTMHRSAPQQRIIWPKMSIVPRPSYSVLWFKLKLVDVSPLQKYISVSLRNCMVKMY